MYSLPYFKESDPGEIMTFIREHPFAFLSGASATGLPVATQVPVFIEERDSSLFLTGHIMRQTDHHKAFAENAQVLCVFTGAHTYVSATWYSNPHQASTWNYMSVHVRGTLRFLDERGLIEVLKKTTLHFEEGNRDSSTIYDNLPTTYIDRLLGAIIAFEIKVTDLQNVFKLSQNRDQESYRRIIKELEKGDADAKTIAGEMKKREAILFSSR